MQRIFTIEPSIMNYSWGKIGKDSLAFRLLGEVEKDLPYAELWYGAHPKSASKLAQTDTDILSLFKNYPELLGKQKSLPFLAKFLSIGQALSIQTHPTKQQAALLRQKDPANYPDDNHKPEVAVALSDVSMLHGWISTEELDSIKTLFPEIKQLDINSWGSEDKKELIKKIFRGTDLSSLSIKISGRLQSKHVRTKRENLFLELFALYGAEDPGLLLSLFLRLLELKPFEAIYTPAGQIHAYLSGNLFECMSNSDNVIRAGLTKKFIDINSLLEYANFDDCKITAQVAKTFETDRQFLEFSDQSDEFKVLYKQSFAGEISFRLYNQNPELIVVDSGQIQLSESGRNFGIRQGQAVLIAASEESDITISGNNSSFFRIFVPN